MSGFIVNFAKPRVLSSVLLMWTAALGSAASAAEGGSPIVRSTYVVAAAGFSLLDEVEGSNGELRVERLNMGEISTYLQYQLVFGDVMYVGAGTIPNEAFRLEGKSGSASLEFDASRSADFEASQCTIEPGGSYSCNPQPTGMIQVVWSSNGLLDITDRTVRHLAYERRTRSAAQQLSSWEKTADASGVAFAYAFETLPGSAGAWVSGSTERLNVRE